MALSWSTRRQFLYYVVATVVGAVLLTVIWQTLFTRTPTCSDGVRNGNEAGVDCGGSCTQLCSEQARAPSVLWVRAFQSGPQSYTAVAYVQNLNSGAGAHSVPFSFQLFDAENLLVVERRGVVDLPPIQTIPVVVTNIDIGNRSVARTLFEFEEAPLWQKIPTENLPPLRLTGQTLTPDATRLTATLVNDSYREVRNLTLTALVFDQSGIARAASRTVLERVAARAETPVVFTWTPGFEGATRAEITILPSF